MAANGDELPFLEGEVEPLHRLPTHWPWQPQGSTDRGEIGRGD